MSRISHVGIVTVLCLAIVVFAPSPVMVHSQLWNLKEWNLYKVLPNGQYEATTTFSKDDIAAECWIQIEYSTAGIELVWEWIQPNGVVYRLDKQVTFVPPNELFTFERLDIRGRLPASLLGAWAIEFFANSQRLFRIDFTIDGITVTTTRQTSTVPPASSTTSKPENTLSSTFVTTSLQTPTPPSFASIRDSRNVIQPILSGVVIGFVFSVPLSLYRRKKWRRNN